jgi:DNA-binding NarL/FixJ family response regulator
VLAPITDLELLEPAVRVSRPAVLVSDLDFRGVSALAVLKRLARDVPATRTIVLTGFDTEVIREGCLVAGVADFVAKVAPVEELTDAIDAAMTSSMKTSPMGESSRLSKPTVAGRSRHNGPLIKWLLESGFPQQMIADAIGVSVKTVEYHSRRMRDQART